MANAPPGRRFLTVLAGQSLSEIGTMLSGVGVAVSVFLDTSEPLVAPRAPV